MRVLELGNNISAPLACTILGELGEDVIKVEPPQGDDRRKIELEGVKGLYFASVNRNKRSVSIDLKRKEGLEIFEELLSTADVVVTNYRPRALSKLGVDFEEAVRVNPKVIYCSITGYGRREGDRPAYDATVLAESGLMDLTGYPGGPPSKFATSIADVTTAMMAAISVLHAYASDRRPVLLDVPMLQTQLYLSLEDAYAVLNGGTSPTRTGSAHRYLVPYQAFRTSDGYVYVAVFNDSQFLRLCDAIGREDLKAYSTNSKRVRAKEIVVAEIQREMERETRDRWIDVLRRYDVPCAPVLTLGEAIRRYGEVTEVGAIKYLNFPLQTWVGLRRPSPGLGEHTVEVLEELGYSREEVEDMARKGIVKMMDRRA
ncbi:CoA transferase [Sulfodiicoccus acidiphilus]|uniref:CoA transferase n=2 Tax=Sulfodiicoccus acidiphilus TaxID=1670455 RepID=A0A348B618_9CREN|nr:CoA transferase [Sulfodiicoccus acidiphilus]GGU04710.1 CoA transferase [Sulfodiicoccus acidiphilus]